MWFKCFGAFENTVIQFTFGYTNSESIFQLGREVPNVWSPRPFYINVVLSMIFTCRKKGFYPSYIQSMALVLKQRYIIFPIHEAWLNFLWKFTLYLLGA